MKKYLYIVLLVFFWSCEDERSHGHDEIELRYITLKRCSSVEPVAYFSAYRHAKNDNQYNNTMISLMISSANGCEIINSQTTTIRECAYIKIIDNKLHYAEYEDVGNDGVMFSVTEKIINDYPVNEQAIIEEFAYNWYWQTTDGEYGSSIIEP